MSYVYSNEKFNISAYLSYSGSDWERMGQSSGVMMHDSLHTAREWQAHSGTRSWHHNIWGNLNASYEFDSMNSISGWFGTYPSFSNDKTDDTTTRTDYDIVGTPHNMSYLAGSQSSGSNNGGFGGLWFTHKFDKKGHQYSINLDGNWWSWKRNETSWRHYDYQPQMNYDHQIASNDLSGNGSIGIDYSYPYSEQGEIETGLDLGMGGGYELYLRDTMDADGNYYCDILRSDSSRTHDRDVSAYLTWRRKWGNFTMKLGLRGRYAYSTSSHDGLPQYDTAVHHFTASPSVHLSYRTKDMHNFSLGYTMHTNKPNAESLSRYENFGIESYSTGNPLLQPSYSHNVDASWNKYFEKFGSVGVSATYRAEADKRGSLPDARYVDFFGRVVSYTKPYNVGDTRQADLNFNVMYRPSGFFNVRLNGGVAYRWYNLQVRPDEWVEKGMPSWNVRLKVWTKVWNKVELFVHQRTPQGHQPRGQRRLLRPQAVALPQLQRHLQLEWMGLNHREPLYEHHQPEQVEQPLHHLRPYIALWQDGAGKPCQDRRHRGIGRPGLINPFHRGFHRGLGFVVQGREQVPPYQLLQLVNAAGIVAQRMVFALVGHDVCHSAVAFPVVDKQGFEESVGHMHLSLPDGAVAA